MTQEKKVQTIIRWLFTGKWAIIVLILGIYLMTTKASLIFGIILTIAALAYILLVVLSDK